MFLQNRGKYRLAKAGLILFGLAVGLGLAEVGLRLIDYSFPEFYRADAVRGYSLRPGIQGSYRKEGTSYVRINSDGLRDREHSKAKPLNTIRIAILGDSYAEALQVPMESSFWAVMERKLNDSASAPSQIEIINFGVSGYGTGQELLTLRNQVWAYSPDFVVLAVTTNNDISDNSRALKNSADVPYFVYRGNEVVVDDSFKSSASFLWRRASLTAMGRLFRDHSRVFQIGIETHRILRLWLTAWRRGRQAQLQPAVYLGAGVLTNSGQVSTENMIYLPPINDTWRNAWRITEDLIGVMNSEVRSRGARFIVVTLSSSIQAYPDSERRRAFMQQLGVTDLFYPEKRIKGLGERFGFPVVNLAPDLQSYSQRHNVFLHGFGKSIGDGHWNETGHRVAGEMLAQKFLAEGWVK